MNDTEVTLAMAALSNPMRLQLFRALVVVGPRGLRPGAIVDALKIPPPTLSFHLKELVASGLVTQERSGRNFIYRAAYEQMNALIGYLTANCCQGDACAVDAPASACVC